jgi:hypothetical protein
LGYDLPSLWDFRADAIGLLPIEGLLQMGAAAKLDQFGYALPIPQLKQVD